jgi:hypothetical protein
MVRRRGLPEHLVFGNEAAGDRLRFGDRGAPSAQRARPAPGVSNP